MQEQFDEEERKELKRIRAAEPKEIRMVKPQPDGSIRRGGVVHGSDCVGILRHHATRPSVDAVDNRHGACGAPQGQLPRARSSFRSTVQPKQHCSPAPQGTSARSMRPDWPRPPAPGLPSDTAVEAQEPVRLRIEATDSRTTGTNMSVQDLEDQGLGLTDDPVRLALEAGGDGRVRVKLQLAALGEEDVAPVPDAAACHLHAPDARGRESFPTAPNEGDNSEATTPVDVPFPDTEEPPVRLCLQVTDAGVEGVRLVQDDEQGIRAGGGPQTQRGRTVKLEYIPTSTGVTAVKLIPAQPAAIPAPGHQRQQLASRAPGSGGISSKASPGSKILSPSVLSMGGWNSRSAAVAPSTLPDFGDDFASSEELLNENLDDSIMCPAETLFNIWREDYAGRSMRVVTISAPYWVNNVTGYHLVFADERSAGTQTTLCGEMFTEVLVPFQVALEQVDLRFG